MNFLSTCDPMAGCGKDYPSDLTHCPDCGTDHAFSSPSTNVDPRDWGYDIETFPNIFTCCFIHAATGMEMLFEISDRMNQWQALVEFAHNLGRSQVRGIGYNNLEFDYPLLHWIAQAPDCTPQSIFEKAQYIITTNNVNSWSNMVWDRDQIFQQLDLLKINHFDNKARRTSLKALEVAMQSRNIKDLPFPVGATLTDAQKDVLIEYNKHDVRETLKFYMRCLEKVNFREELSKMYGRNFMNHADTKIGKDFFVMKLEEKGVNCKNVTIRDRIALGDCIPDYIRLETEPFVNILNRMKEVVLTRKQQEDLLTTKGVFKDMVAVLDDIEYTFGLGGIHSGIPCCVYKSGDGFVMSARDVTSLYPSLSIENNYYPEHLGPIFCEVYKQLFIERRDAKRAGNKNVDATLKLALNGTFGNMGSIYSPFCDHKCLLSITITGQLSMVMLIEQLRKVPQMTICQSNTDGVILHHPEEYTTRVNAICDEWMKTTRLNLECEDIAAVYQRDVNNYIQLGTDGKLKRKGAYEYNYQWHQDPSAMIVARAAEAALVHGKDIREFITSHRNKFDFILRAKVPRAATLVMRWPEWNAEQVMQNTTRYFMSRSGGYLVKKMKPKGQPGTYKRKNKLTDDFYYSVLREIQATGGERMDAAGTPYDSRIHTGKGSMWQEWTESSLCAGHRVTECADANEFDWSSLSYDWYIAEAEKLVLPLIK